MINLFVNDEKVRRLNHPHRGAKIGLAVADDATADVRAEVTLLPRAKGKHGRVVEVAADYDACS